MKKRIAIWMHGGIGSGVYSQGQPCIHKLVKRLAVHYSVDVYMLLSANDDFVPEGFALFTARAKNKSGILGWISLLLRFLVNHRKNKYTLLYSFWGYPSGFIVTLLSKLFRRPCLIHLQGGDAAYIPSLNYGVFCNPVRRKLCIWAYSQCDVLIALTNYQKQFLVRFGITRQIHIIPYGVDTDFFSYLPLRKQSPKINCLHIGNQTPIKDQETLLRAFELLIRKVPAHLTLIGSDHDKGKLRQLSHDLQIQGHISFLGPLPYKELPQYYHAADVLIVTSIFEGQGLVITEAAACGPTLAGTPVGILADMGEDCGIISPVGDSEALASKIIEGLSQPAIVLEKKSMARNWAVEKNEDFTFRRIVEELNRIIVE